MSHSLVERVASSASISYGEHSAPPSDAQIAAADVVLNLRAFGDRDDEWKMPRLAKLSEQYAVIRSMTHKVAEHKMANSMMLAGRENPAADDPSFGAMVAKLRPAKASIPDHVWLQKFGGGAAPPDHTYLTGGHLGMAYAPMLLGQKHDDNPATPGYRVRAFDTPENISPKQIADRRRLLEATQQLSPVGNTAEFDAFDTHQQRSIDLLNGRAAKDAFNLDRETVRMRDRYGRNPLGQHLLLARRLVGNVHVGPRHHPVDAVSQLGVLLLDVGVVVEGLVDQVALAHL